MNIPKCPKCGQAMRKAGFSDSGYGKNSKRRQLYVCWNRQCSEFNRKRSESVLVKSSTTRER